MYIYVCVYVYVLLYVRKCIYIYKYIYIPCSCCLARCVARLPSICPRPFTCLKATLGVYFRTYSHSRSLLAIVPLDFRYLSLSHTHTHTHTPFLPPSLHPSLSLSLSLSPFLFFSLTLVLSLSLCSLSCLPFFARFLSQERERVANERIVAKKVAARGFSHRYIGDVISDVFGNLEGTGFFYDPLVKEIEDSFVPWLLDGVSSSISGVQEAQNVMDASVAAAMDLASAKKKKSADDYVALEAAKGKAIGDAVAAAAKAEEDAAAAAAAQTAAEGAEGGGDAA